MTAAGGGSSCSSCTGKSSSLSICPFSAFLFITSSIAYTQYLLRRSSSTSSSSKAAQTTSTEMGCNTSSTSDSNSKAKFQVVFVLGGPGAGKGTQCTLLSDRMSWTHLSAGDLLREERKSGSELAELINSKISAGQIVPSSITVKLLKGAMEQIYEADNTKTKFLVDGFPRSAENVSVWDEHMPASVAKLEFVLFFDCPEDVMTGRILERAKTSGRNDDNLETIRKRFKTFRDTTMPIVDMFEKKGMVKTVIADKSVDDVYTEVEAFFQSLKS